MKRILLILTLFFYIQTTASAENATLQDVTIIVSSYDKYANLWPTFFDLLFKNWPSLNTYNKDVPIILISNTKSYHDPRVTVVKSPYEKGWVGNMNDALKQVKTKYILYLQDDYFINDIVLEDKIHDILAAMEINKLDYCEMPHRLTRTLSKRSHDNNAHVRNNAFLVYKKSDVVWFSLQISLWSTDLFRELIAENSNVGSIWNFEHIQPKSYQKLAYYSRELHPIPHINIMHRGNIDIRSYTWLYYKDYDLSFLSDYKIHTKYKILNIEGEWLKQNTPMLANTLFYIRGFFLDKERKIKRIIGKFQDEYNEKRYSEQNGQ